MPIPSSLPRAALSAVALAVLLPLAACGLSDDSDSQDAPRAEALPSAATPSPEPDRAVPATATPETAPPSPAASSAAAAAPSPGPARTGPDAGADLWGRSYVATRATEGGQPRPLAAGTEVVVTFEQRPSGGLVSWQAGCNTMGASVEVRRDRLDVGDDVGGTSAGCDAEREAQDAWLTGFFGGDPWWELQGERLLLQHADTLFELEPRPQG
jgi:heat shock protein HslJ